uniref:Uncharacterized protein n=1 Tax=Arundo donax TaxID=35708 RepID=A0A0A9F730_ARUDO
MEKVGVITVNLSTRLRAMLNSFNNTSLSIGGPPCSEGDLQRYIHAAQLSSSQNS